MQRMIRLSAELGQRVVERYREDVARFGHTSQFEGEVMARIMGCSAVWVAHGTTVGLTDWQRLSQSIVGHVVAYAASDRPDIDPDNMFVHAPTLQEFAAVTMAMLERGDPQLSLAYQSVLLKSCGGMPYLTEVRGSPELSERFLNTAVSFVTDLLSIWYLQAKVAFA